MSESINRPIFAAMAAILFAICALPPICVWALCFGVAFGHLGRAGCSRALGPAYLLMRFYKSLQNWRPQKF